MNQYAASALATAVVLAAPGAHAAAPTEPGVLLRDGEWRQDVGSYDIPTPFLNIKTSQWPERGWFRLSLGAQAVEVAAVTAPSRAKPAFLKEIVRQIDGAAGGDAMDDTPMPDEARTEFLYLRVPGVTLRAGAYPAYRFANGTTGLRPILDKRYELILHGTPFALTVQNGLRTSQGTAYGEGALYTIEYDGARYEYLMHGFGWEATIRAIADIDGDGKPDFILYSGGNNSGHDAIILSSLAKPGRNPLTAWLKSTGC